MKDSIESTISVKKRFRVYIREDLMELKSLMCKVHIRPARWAIQGRTPFGCVHRNIDRQS
jgi:hypothetical protein